MSAHEPAPIGIGREEYKDYREDWQDQEPDLGMTSESECMAAIAQHYDAIEEIYKRAAIVTGSQQCRNAYEGLAREAALSARYLAPWKPLQASF